MSVNSRQQTVFISAMSESSPMYDYFTSFKHCRFKPHNILKYVVYNLMYKKHFDDVKNTCDVCRSNFKLSAISSSS